MTSQGLIEALTPNRVAGWVSTSTRFVDVALGDSTLARVRIAIDRPDVAEVHGFPETQLGFEYRFAPSLQWDDLADVTVRTVDGVELPQDASSLTVRGHRDVPAREGWSSLFEEQVVDYARPILGFPPHLSDSSRERVEGSYVLHAVSSGADVGVLEDAWLLGAQGAVAVGTSLLGDSTYLINPQFDAPGVFSTPRGDLGWDVASEAVRHDSRPLLSALSGGYTGYYHWLLDVLLRLALGREATGEDRVVVLPEIRTQFAADSVRLLGLPLDRVTFCDPRTIVRAADVAWVSSALHQWQPGGGFADAPSPYLREVFRAGRVLPVEGTASGRDVVYISRSDATKRRLVNERDVESMLERRGVRVLRMTGMPLEQQIAEVAGAKVVIGPHGAGLTNLLFAQSAVTLVELVAESWVNPCFHRLTTAGGDRYAAWVCETQDDHEDEHQRTTVCDVSGLARFLDQLDV